MPRRARGSPRGATRRRPRRWRGSGSGTTGRSRCRGSATRGAVLLIVGPRAGRARRQPHRTRVHRRPLRRLPLRVAAPHRLREPADQRASRRWARTSRLLHHCRGQVRAPAEQADARRARRVPAVFRPASSTLLNNVRVIVALGQFGWDAVCTNYGIRPRPPFGHGNEVALPGRRTLHRLVPRQPAEHVHQAVDVRDARHRLPACARARKVGRLGSTAMRLRLAVIALVGLAVVLAACSGGASHYGNDTEGAFMESCTVKQQQPQSICRCTYDEITQRIPFDSYVELDKQLQKDPKTVPDELLQIVADCGSRTNASGSPGAIERTGQFRLGTSGGSNSSSSLGCAAVVRRFELRRPSGGSRPRTPASARGSSSTACA